MECLSRPFKKEINLRHGAYYAQSGIYNWIVRFSKEAVSQGKAFTPAVSDAWPSLRYRPVEAAGQNFLFSGHL